MFQAGYAPAARGLRRSVSALALTVAVVGATAAHAQSTPAPQTTAPATDDAAQVDDVVVTGIRARIASSQAIKRDSDTFVDAVTADDIGALPDKSVNEVLQRIPGVNINRFQGPTDPDHFSVEGSNVIIRGLSYVRSEFNGRDAFSVNTGRALGFNDVSPELLASVQVFKNATADRIEGGIAGVVDLRTRKPFDSRKFVFGATAEGSYGDLREKPGLGFSSLISNVWDTQYGSFGALLSYGESDLYSEAYGSHLTDFTYRSDLSNGEDRRYVPRGGAVRTQQFDRSRSTLDGSLQWESTDGRAKLTGEYIRADSTSAWGERVVEVDLGSGGNPTPLPGQSFTYDSNGVFTSGLLVSNSPNLQVLPKRQRDLQTLTEDFSLAAEFHPTDRLSIWLDAQYSKANADDLDMSVYGAITPLYTLIGEGRHGVPDIQFVDASGQPSASTNDPSNFYYRSAMDHIEQSDGNQTAFKADVKYDFDNSPLRAIRMGARYSDREQTRRYTAYNWGAISESWAGGVTPFQTRGPLAVEAYDFPNFQRGHNPTPMNGFYPTADLIAAYRDGTLQAALAAASSSGSTWRPLDQRPGAIAGTPFLPGDINNSAEQTTSAYVRFDFGWDDIFGPDTAITGNLGVRYAKTDFQTRGFISSPNIAQNFGDANGNDPRFPGQNIPVTQANAAAIARFRCSTVQPGQSAPGYCLLSNDRLNQLVAFSDGSFQEIERGNSYDDWLPSLNVNLKYKEWVFRGAVSRAMTRPDFGVTAFAATLFYTDMNQVRDNGGDVNTAPLLTTFTGGSQLTGVRSWNYDLGVEWYFKPGSSLTFNAFYKDLSDILASGSTVQQFSNAQGVSTDVQVNQQVNIGSGWIKGFEVGYQQTYSFLPGLWSGLGIEANYTYVEPSTFPNAVTEPRYVGLELPLQQLSKHTYNFSVFYEKDRLSARLAYNWRNGFLLTPRDDINPFSPIFNDSTGQLDGSIFYTLNDNWKIGLYGANLLDEVTVTQQQTSYNLNGANQAGPLAPRSYFRSDRRVTFSLRYTF